MGVYGLCFFMVGYEFVRKFLVNNQPQVRIVMSIVSPALLPVHKEDVTQRGVAYLVAALCSLVWQKRKRNSLSCFANPYLDAIVLLYRSIADALQQHDTTLKPQAQAPRLSHFSQSECGRHNPDFSAVSQTHRARQRLHNDTSSASDFVNCFFPSNSREATQEEKANMSFRPGSRIFNAFRPFFRQQRNQSSAAPEQSAFQKLWQSPVGPKTVHFW